MNKKISVKCLPRPLYKILIFLKHRIDIKKMKRNQSTYVTLIYLVIGLFFSFLLDEKETAAMRIYILLHVERHCITLQRQ